MSSGRAFLGLGTGKTLNEYAATGQWSEYVERQARLEESIALMREEMLRALQPYIDLGFDHLILHSPSREQIPFIERFGREVLPRLRSAGVAGDAALAGAGSR